MSEIVCTFVPVIIETAMNENPYFLLAKFILPKEMLVYFDLESVRSDEYGGEQRLHLYLDEKELKPEGSPDASPNGFYEESCMNHFPVNEYRTILHVRRRRWKDSEGRSLSKDWHLVAQGTRYSKEFAAFLKEFVGYIPDYGQIAPETVSHKR